MDLTFAQMADLMREVGAYIVFLYLFIREVNRHDETRKKYIDDLREIAGIKPALTKSYKPDALTVPRESEMQNP